MSDFCSDAKPIRSLRHQCPACHGTAVVDYVRWHKKNTLFHYFRCAACRLVYVADPLAVEETAPNEIFPSVPLVRRRHQQIVRLIDNYRRTAPPGPVRIVEIGCGHGALGLLLRDATRYDYRGFEPDTPRAEYCVKQDLQVSNCFFSREKLTAPVDIVVLDNVLEHVHDLSGLLAEVAACLKNAGMVVVIVPNLHDVRRFLPRWRNRHFWQPHCHINSFSFQSLESLLARFDFAVESFGFSSLAWVADKWFLPKVLFDQLGMHFGGLYCVGRKRPPVGEPAPGSCG